MSRAARARPNPNDANSPGARLVLLTLALLTARCSGCTNACSPEPTDPVDAASAPEPVPPEPQTTTSSATRAPTGRTPEPRLLPGAQAPAVVALAVTPDAKRLVAAGHDASWIWSLETGELIRTLPAVGESISLSADGATLIALHFDGPADPKAPRLSSSVDFYDLATGQRTRSHPKQARAVAWSPNGKLIGTSGPDGVAIWDPPSGKVLWRVATPDGPPSRVLAFSFNGERLASGQDNHQIHQFSVDEGYAVRELPVKDQVLALAFSSDGDVLATGDLPEPGLYSAETGQLLRRLIGHWTYVSALAFSPDRKTLASGSVDRTIRTWDWRSGRALGVFRAHDRPVTAVVWTAGGRVLISAGEDGLIRIWDAAKSSLELSLSALPTTAGAPPEWISWTKDADYLASPGAPPLLEWRGEAGTLDFAALAAEHAQPSRVAATLTRLLNPKP